MPASYFVTRPASRFVPVILLLTVVGATAMLYYHLGLFIPRSTETSAAKGLGNGYAFGNDLYQVWLTSGESVRDRRDPYSAKMTRDIQTGLYGRPLDTRIPSDPVDRRTFPYPAFTLLLFRPVAELPFAVVRVAFVVGLAAMTCASILIWMRMLAWRPGWQWLAVIVLLALGSYPVLEGLYAGQLGLLVAFLLAASILALQRGCLLLAGILMALTTIKPQVTLLLILYLLLWSTHDRYRRGRFAWGLFPSMLLLLGASLAVWPRWIGSWVQTMVAYHHYTRPALVNEAVASHLGQSLAGPAGVIMTAGLMIFAVGLAWRNRTVDAGSPEFCNTAATLLAITAITLLPGQAVYDHVILLPGAFLLARQWRALAANWILKALLTMGAATLLWPWITSFALILLRPLLTREQFYSTAIFSLPLRTAAAFPFVVLGLLVLRLRAPATGEDGLPSLPF